MGQAYDEFREELSRAGRAVAQADALLITAGAGMGVDSGLPDFRGTEGFWRAYPPLAKLGLRFEQMANPAWFHRDPHLAWGFYGHRLNLYRATPPHAGFATLLRWCAAKPAGGFVFTSNVDGHFQRAGFADDRVVECHGSLNHFQCAGPCDNDIWPAGADVIAVDEHTLRAADPLPSCPNCGGPARPNVLMFGDGGWSPTRTYAQSSRYEAWLDDVEGGGAKLVVIELGAGSAIPTVRMQSERAARRLGGVLVRVNPREPSAPPGDVSLPMGANDAVQAIDQLLGQIQ